MRNLKVMFMLVGLIAVALLGTAFSGPIRRAGTVGELGKYFPGGWLFL